MVSLGGLKGSRKQLDQRIEEMKEAAERIRRQREKDENKPDGREG